NLVILDSNSDPVTNILYPGEYTCTFNLIYNTIDANANDTAKALGYIEQEIIDNGKTFRNFYQFDRSTRKNINFLTAGASANDFSNSILVGTLKAETVGSDTLVTITCKVTNNTPLGNFVLCLNHEPDELMNTRKNLFVFSLPVSPTPPDLGI